eukprot:XP_014039453.1 PREDICTED: nidogen-2-like [Salmo salar]
MSIGSWSSCFVWGCSEFVVSPFLYWACWLAKETITMAILTIIVLVSTAFALGDAMIRPCEDARDAAKHGPPGAYVPTCDDNGQYTPEQCSGSTGYCWCVTSYGQKIQGTETPPGTAINC